MLVALRSKTNPGSSILRLLLPRFFSASAIQNPDPKSSNFNVVDYLVASWGFSPDKAARASKRLAHIRSPERPDSIRRFLVHQGFSDSDINAIVKRDPEIFRFSLEKNLDPKLRALRGMALSLSAQTKILLSSPQVIQRSSALPNIHFWLDFLGGDEELLIKAFKYNKRLVTLHIGKNIQPKMSLFQSRGLSTDQIRRIVLGIPELITANVGKIEDYLERVNELGFQPTSGMFMHMLKTIKYVTRNMLQKKMELLQGFGWSENDFFSALQRAPTWASLSENSLRVKMDFLMGEAKCDPSYIASHPLLLAFSLKARLRPRQNVIHLLESKGLSIKRLDYFYIMKISNNKFAEMYIFPNKKEVTGLHETFVAACGKESTIFEKAGVADSVSGMNVEC